MVRLCICADASEHWMIKYSISVESLMGHTKQLFSFENSGCSLISSHASAQSYLKCVVKRYISSEVQHSVQ